MEQQQADALALLAETALHQGLDPGNSGERYQVVVHVDAEVLADADAPGQSALEDGARVPAGTSQRLACDASRVVMRHGPDGRVVEVDARTRTIPPAIRRALHHRDRGCRFPGCGVRFGQGHHIRHWAQGGPTTLSNLAMLCRRHHRAVHEEGYEVERKLDGTLRFRRPDGRLMPEVPPPPEVPGESGEGAPGAARSRRARSPRTDGDATLGGRAAGRRLGHRRPAPTGEVGIMARKAKSAAGKSVESLRHQEAKRRNIPTAEYQSVIQKEAEQPLCVAYERRNRDLDPQFWSDLVGSRSNMRDEEWCLLTPFIIKRSGNAGQSFDSIGAIGLVSA